VRGLGIRMLTLDTKTSLYVEDRGFQVPMDLEHGKNGGDSIFARSVAFITQTLTYRSYTDFFDGVLVGKVFF
jgi:hypothetical protein